MKNMFLICNAHIDPVWQWELNEGIGAAISTFRVAAELCEKYDTFVFNHNEAILYKWIEDYEPELFDKIKEQIKLGRWHIMGGWYLQPDCNMPGGESFVRLITYGLNYFFEKFNQRPKTAINFDPFGHTIGLVQIMEKAGFDSYIICRPYSNELELPSEKFLWKGFCDSELMVLRLPSYNTPLGKADIRIKEAMEKQNNMTNGVILWGVGNHGGGPSKIDLEKITTLIGNTKDIKIIHSTPELYFEELSKERESLPSVDFSLNPTMTGCYTSQIRIKQKHRKLESEILVAEKMSSHACSLGLMEYPKEEIKRVWEDLMFAQFHDILPGSSIQPVEETGLRILDHGIQETANIKTKAFYKLSCGQKKAKNGEIPVLVYNPHSFEVKTLIDCEFMLPDQNFNDEYILPEVYQNNKKIKSQPEKELSNIPIQWRKRIVFEAILKPFAMNRYDIKLKTIPKRKEEKILIEDGHFNFSNEQFSFKININTGLADSYKVNDEEFIKDNSFKILVIKDNEDPWGMGIKSYNDVLGCFVLADSKTAAKICGVKSHELDPVRIIETGEVRTVVEAIFKYNNSQAVVRYFIPKNGLSIKVQIRLIVNEKDLMFKLSLPTTIQNGKYIGKTAYGSQNLESNGNEVVSQHWAMIKDEKRAFSCINEGNYGSSCENGEIRVSLIRTSAYCAHPIENRETLIQDRFTERIDQGERIFNFYLNASDLNSRKKNIETESMIIHEAPVAVCFFPPGGEKSLKSLCEIDNITIILSAFKSAEKSNGYIARLFNSGDTNQSAKINFPALEISKSLEFKSYEIKTMYVNYREAEIVDFFENKL